MSLPVDFVWRLLLAAVLGAAVGLEREYREKPAGLRTNILIALGSSLFTILSISMGTGNGPAGLIGAQIVSGVGFLGGGAILRSGDNVRGMTTAATIWINAAIGMAAGMGQYVLATLAALLTLVVLTALPRVESYFERRVKHTGRVRLADDEES
jgi:putative Mg2+ transporter-C (MgtC) family protein